MKCANGNCFNQFDQPANKLNECASCHAKHAQRISGGAASFAASMVRWMEEVESKHGKTIFYSDEFKKANKSPFTVSPDLMEETLKKPAYAKLDQRVLGQMKTLK